MPAKMTFDEAAAIPVVYLTAFHMLFWVGHLRPRDKLLIHAAAGGVGLAVIQLAQLGEGVEIFGTASAKKHALLRDLGVAHTIDYGTQDFEEEIRKITGGRGVNMALDPVGGKNWTRSYNSLAKSGHLICFGWSAMVDGEKRDVFHVASEFVKMRWWNGMNLMKDNKTISGVNMGGLWDETDLMRHHLTTLVKLYSEGKIKPHVDQVFPLSKGADAHRFMQQRRNVGKVIFDTTA
jgi:NADPH:quinone reductase-like Zn-dependent oxidoreductase